MIAFIVSNFYENLSILTGFPFGHYHYTDALGPKLFLVPLLISPAYFGCGYLAWSLAHVFVGVFGNKLRADQIWRVTLVAAFVMVMWDLTMDPRMAEICQPRSGDPRSSPSPQCAEPHALGGTARLFCDIFNSLN